MPSLTPDQRERLYVASKAILAEAGYVGAGTCEFLVGRDGTLSFLEVNTRLQVEHPVSEEVSGRDLVRETLRIADGEALGYEDPPSRGHAIEFRINAEDPGRDFLPVPGRLTVWRAPAGPGVRVDEGYRAPASIPAAFDSLVAKIIVTGANRQQAIQRARRALAETVVEGVPTVLPFHRRLLTEPDFAAGESEFCVHTRWIETEFDNTIEPWEGPATDDSGSTAKTEMVVEVDGKRLHLAWPTEVLSRVLLSGGLLSGGLLSGGSIAGPNPVSQGPAARPKPQRSRSRAGSSALPASDNAVTAPLPGTVVKVAVADGEHVGEGDLIAVLEAMKMEHPLSAHRAGVVASLTARPGDSVNRGASLCQIVDG